MPSIQRNCLLFVIVLPFIMNGCSSVEEVDDSYRGAKSVKSLQLPDGLTPASGLNTIAVPEIETDKDYTSESLLALEQPPQIVSSVDLQAALGEGADKKAQAQQDAQAVGAPDSGDANSNKAAQEQTVDGKAALSVADGSKQQKQTLNAQTTATPDGTKILLVKADFEKTWPVVGSALVELGFDIEDSSKGNGVYSIVKVLPVVEFEKKNPHPGDETEDIKEEFQIHLKEVDKNTELTVHNKYGKLEGSGLADHLLLQIESVIKAD